MKIDLSNHHLSNLVLDPKNQDQNLNLPTEKKPILIKSKNKSKIMICLKKEIRDSLLLKKC